MRIRSQLFGFAEMIHGAVHLSQLVERGPEIALRFRRIRIQLRSPFQTRSGRGAFPKLDQGATEPAPRPARPRVNLEGFLVHLAGFLESLLALQFVADITMRFRLVGSQLHRILERSQRVGPPALLLKNRGQARESGDERWVQGDRTLAMFQCLVEFARVGQGHPKAVVGVHVIRVEHERPAVTLNGLCLAALFGEDGAKIVVGLGGRRVQLDR